MCLRPALSIALLAAALIGAGCDTHRSPTTTARVAIDARALFRAGPDGLAVCASVADEMLLTVTDGAGTRRYRQPLTLEEAAVVFEVEVEPGSVDFEAAVQSNNGTLLYSASRTERVEDGFNVTLPLTRRAPVLQVCPAPVVLRRNPNGAAGSFFVHNLGVGPLVWVITPPPGSCAGGPCTSFDEDAGTLAAGLQEEVFVAALPAFTGGTALVVSPVGTVVLTIQVQ